MTDNTLKKITQDVLVTCSAIVSDHNVKTGRSFSKFGRTMSGDRLLFPALDRIFYVSINQSLFVLTLAQNKIYNDENIKSKN